jgi:organic hydroperoxide reductase OsmC/OhrA
MSKQHHYSSKITWTGNAGKDTLTARDYERSHTISIQGKPIILASSDTPFRGDGAKHNPEDLLLSALSSCHMLWYLHLCADAGVLVKAYEDEAKGVMEEKSSGGGNFIEVILTPRIQVAEESMIAIADKLHVEANKKCFIANSCNFPVKHIATYFI